MKKTFLIIFSCLILGSCATILTGGKARVAIDAPKNSGTTVSVNGIEMGQTPIQLKLKADDILTFEKEGYDSKTVVIGDKFNTIAILNLFSLLGWGIDAVTGSLKIPDQKLVNVTLKESN